MRRSILTHTYLNHSIYFLRIRVCRSPLSPEVLAAHEEVEEMLQSYVMDFNSVRGKLESLRSQIQTT